MYAEGCDNFDPRGYRKLQSLCKTPKCILTIVEKWCGMIKLFNSFVGKANLWYTAKYMLPCCGEMFL